MTNATTYRRRHDDIQTFAAALSRLLAVCDASESDAFLTIYPSWTPKPGREAEAARLVSEVDRASGRAAVALGASCGGEVESELGSIAGDEDVAVAVAAGALTDPAEARAFVDRTGAACLAVSIGNVHGTYTEPPQLDWLRLEAIRAQVPVHLSLHGASGLDATDLAQAIRLGISKVNVNTE